MYNTHIHAFQNEAVPRCLFGGISRFFYKHKKIKWIIHALYRIRTLTNNDLWERIGRYTEIGSLKSWQILDHVFQFYPDDTKFVVLTMDMVHMGAGKPKQKYYEQLEELATVEEILRIESFKKARKKILKNTLIEAIPKIIETSTKVRKIKKLGKILTKAITNDTTKARKIEKFKKAEKNAENILKTALNKKELVQFEETLKEEKKEIEKKYSEKRILPFICIDPRRTDWKISKDDKKKREMIDFIEYWRKRGFRGIKIYPPLGYFPWDKDLHKVYSYAIEHEIPIITHCSPGVINSRECRRKLKKRIRDNKSELIRLKVWNVNDKLRCISRKKLCSYFTHPYNYKKVIEDLIEDREIKNEDLSKLKICFAHFGGATEVKKYLYPKSLESIKENWFYYIRNLLEESDVFYVDISGTWGDSQFDPLLKLILLELASKTPKKILFGSDYYMNQISFSERNFGLRIRGYLGEDKFKQIAHCNTKTFLYGGKVCEKLTNSKEEKNE